jgi:predicted nucleic acid-binding protein
MILVDTSIWIEHLRFGNSTLRGLLADNQALTHALVIGEIACGTLRNRSQILEDLSALPSARSATDEDVLTLIEERVLWGKGIGWVDAHLLASALLTHCRLWTFDRSLSRAAGELDLT